MLVPVLVSSMVPAAVVMAPSVVLPMAFVPVTATMVVAGLRRQRRSKNQTARGNGCEGAVTDDTQHTVLLEGLDPAAAHRTRDGCLQGSTGDVPETVDLLEE